MANRIIIVPVDRKCLQDFNMGKTNADQILTLELDDSDFYELYRDKVFDAINKVADTMIDDYEDDEIVDLGKLMKVISELEERKYEFKKCDDEIVQEIISLCKEAHERKTGIYFYF